MNDHGPGRDPFHAPAGDLPGSGSYASPRPPAPPPVGAPPPAAETNMLATLSVVFAFVFAPVGAILGHLGLGQIARTGQRGRDRALTGITVSYVVIVAAVIGLVVWAAGGNDTPAVVAGPAPSTPTPTPTPAATTTPAPPGPPPAPTVDAAALPAVLVPLLDLRTLIADPGQTPLQISQTVEMPTNDAGTFDDYSCFPSFVAGTPTAYDGTNWRSFYGSDSVNNQTGLQIGQAAIRFDDATAAKNALTTYLAKWQACSGKSATWTLPSGQTTVVTFGTPTDMGDGITMLTNTVTQMTAPLAFTRLLAVKDNVLVDNGITGVNVGDTPLAVTRAMLNRIIP